MLVSATDWYTYMHIQNERQDLRWNGNNKFIYSNNQNTKDIEGRQRVDRVVLKWIKVHKREERFKMKLSLFKG